MITEKIPQNIQALIGEIGERMALFKLYELIHTDKNLEVFKNYSDIGYDIGIRNSTAKRKIKIEVKTRQRLISTSSEKKRNSCHFTLTENEKNCADFLVGYWIEHNDFFIVPKSELSKNKSGKKMFTNIL